MIKKIYDFVLGILKSIICGALLVAAAAAAVAIGFFAFMSAYRGIELLWREVFSHSWGF